MFKQKQDAKVELVCSTCGKPIASKARTDVTRYLFKQSRCQCLKQGVSIKESPDSSELIRALSNDTKVVRSESRAIDAGEIAKDIVLSNLPDYYEVLAFIGEGGMGTVYKVRDRRLDKIFAIKVLRPQLIEDGNALARFKQEAEAASSLTQANLATVYSYGVGEQGAPYLVMDYCEGENLANLIKREGYIDVPRAIDLFKDIAGALEYAHKKGVIHRDIKPTNIIIEDRDGVKIAKVVDFGIAKIVSSEGKNNPALTQTGDIFGSPLYMSPEQCLGNKLDARSDIYAFGCVMYESLCGKPPFVGVNPIKTILKHISEKPNAIAKESIDQKISSDFDYIVMRCLEKQPADRYQTMSELEQDLVMLSEHKPIKRVRIGIKTSALKQGTLVLVCLISAIVSYSVVSQFSQSYFKNYQSNQFNTVPINPDPDAIRMDSLSYSYFMAGQYDKAIPLLEFDAKVFREGGKRPSYLADTLQHIGKCYKMLGQYERAVPYYQEAVNMYHQWGNYPGSLVPECIKDYADVLRKTNKPDLAEQLEQEWQIK